MPSNSLLRWNGERQVALDEIESAHASVGGTARGRRSATQQTNFAYCTLLSGHFQGFCRDLCSECVDHVVANVPFSMQGFVRESLHLNHSLAKGNPHPGAIGSDFGRLGINFWAAVYSQDAKNDRRRQLLQDLVNWRNAFAHQDFESVSPGVTPTLHLATVKSWRSAVAALARQFDLVAYSHLSGPSASQFGDAACHGESLWRTRKFASVTE